jgi:hypothetical protein
VDLFDQIRVDRKDAKDLREKGARVLKQVVFKGREFLEEEIKFLLGHRLDDEFAVM